MMRKNARWYLWTKAVDRHLVHSLLPLGLIFVILSFILPSLKIIQAGLAIIFIYLYLALSFLHHKEDKSLTISVTLEYILIATLALVLILGILA